ncbi:MAG: nucleotide pyrophosphohydrolase [Candidatus Pacebacteria bacterium]|nr:nucleotide pyrophosphohydrolase [Candidatus Paceibacterota bacterium]
MKELTQRLIDFREVRNWKQFHSPKNLAESISIEANELLEHFQWLDLEESKRYSVEHKQELAEEIADVLNYLVLLAHDLDIDLIEAAIKKIEINNKKYPIKKSKGISTKYNRL